MYAREQDKKDYLGRVVENGDVIIFATSVGHSGALRIAIVLDAKRGLVRSLMKSFYSDDTPKLALKNANIVSFNKAIVVDDRHLPNEYFVMLDDYYQEWLEKQNETNND